MNVRCPICNDEIVVPGAGTRAALYVHIDDTHTRNEIVELVVGVEMFRAAVEEMGVTDDQHRDTPDGPGRGA